MAAAWHRRAASQVTQPPPLPPWITQAPEEYSDPDPKLDEDFTGHVADAAADDMTLTVAQQSQMRAEARDATTLPPKNSEAQKTVAIGGRMLQLLEGEIDVADLDDSELMSGTFRDQSGSLRSSNKLIPKAMHQELMRRILNRGTERIRSDFFDAIDTVTGIMKNDTVDPAVRLRAANIIIDRVAGKVADKIDLTMEVKKYEHVITEIVREMPDAGQTAPEILDAVLVEVDDDDV